MNVVHVDGLRCLRALLATGLLSLAAMSHAQPTAPAVSVRDQAREALRFGDFAALERLYASAARPGARAPQTGTELVTQFWRGVESISDDDLPVSEGYFTQLDLLTQQWAQAHPQSAMAQLLHAQVLRQHAWYVRGTGTYETVSSTALPRFETLLKRSFEQLQRHETLLAQDSSWNLMVIQVGRGLGLGHARLMPIFDNGIARNPDHDELYVEMLTTMLPRWGGSVDIIERFIARAAQATRDTRGLEMYARLYSELSDREVKQRLFSATRASWPSMKAGFEDRLSRHPHVDHRNAYAYFACMAQDRDALQEQLRLLNGSYVRRFWGGTPDRTYDDCKALARQL
ncbi:DUF4034 domain-containing protein [Ideonella sp. 4Y16]|uniref:DUF4034 domain-containing protein n=1 Tax=Ideonella alba TaxID=2824118 RepID=UPI001B35EF24|nr:DUF4034 domain-containing protein [Ideonella alba]MBQ0945437.1 DUF4034 domain-containing protein [Ideonella alba]